jgi:hypothetical protein
VICAWGPHREADHINGVVNMLVRLLDRSVDSIIRMRRSHLSAIEEQGRGLRQVHRMKLAYIAADKYLVADRYVAIMPFLPPMDIRTEFVDFFADGTLVIREGFNFSANWPAINTEDSRRGAAEHDALYWLMKLDLLDRRVYREKVDLRLYEVLREDGMVDFRAWYWYKAVRVGGDDALNSPFPAIKYAPPEQLAQKQPRFGMV